jgi:hypothetical protein
MEITLETLLAKRQDCESAVAQHKALMEANAGAIQILDELIAVARAKKPDDQPPKK